MKSSKLMQKPNASDAPQKGRPHPKATKLAKRIYSVPCSTDPLTLLSKSSPVAITRLGPDPEFYLKRLLPKDRLKCLGTSFRNFSTRRISEFRRPLSRFRLVVPAYMTSHEGLLTSSIRGGTNKRSSRTNDNTDQVRYIVFQSETKTLNEQIEAVERLRTMRDLVMVVRTGHQHIEAWFSTKGMQESEIHTFRCFAKGLGAPSTIFINAQPYAVPGAVNDRDYTNHVIFWNPSGI